MAKNRVQFQKGLSLFAFQEEYGTTTQCVAALFAWRWPAGFVCPACAQSTGYVEVRTRGLLQCKHCRHQTSVTAGTIFAYTKLPLTVWFLAMYLLTQQKNGISALELKRQLGVSYPTAWSIKHKLLQTMLERDADRQLTGVIAIDDAYWGGECHGEAPGRGSPNKILHPDSIVVSDGLGCFRGIADAGPEFHWVNTMIGNVKNAMHGTYHQASPNHLPRYLAEFCYRFNRRFDLAAMLPRLGYAAVRTPPMPYRLLKLAEAHW
ncbi:IS1595 family transposase [uncultured Thiodictyon sp.]|uniref:IS1595 family transposase n=1 Tax=uncultured Thiodictyon sp. TaxID=1846217 RepID=UPI0025F77365|nr:IS1595 family transposase [uncultured Thiodictyon sp.]